MHGGNVIVPAAILLVVIVAPVLLGLAGLLAARRAPAAGPAPAWDWRLTVHSALLYTLAFNLTFFIQELFLVVPKAFVPGLSPVLYHNNHSWSGDHPLEALFQGTGALAIFVSGCVFAWLLRRGGARPHGRQLFFLWMTFHGFFQSIPQIVVGAIAPDNDMGMAMDYLAMSGAAKTAAALVALAAIPLVAFALARPLLALADRPERIASPGARTGFVLRLAALPALAAIPLIVAFRVPREATEVLIPPIAVTIVGLAYLVAGAWRVQGVAARGGGRVSIGLALAAVAALLLVFHLVLRPGIPF